MTLRRLRLATWRVQYAARRSRAYKVYRSIPRPYRLGTMAVLVLGLTLGSYLYIHNQQYNLDARETQLLAKVSVDKTMVKETKDGFEYNRSEEQKAKGPDVVTAAANADSTGKFPYKATLPKKPGQGVSFSDDKGDLSFTITPKFSSNNGRAQSGRVLYAKGSNELHAYTFKRNGIKEDIVLRKAVKDSLQYQWVLSAGDNLEAKLMPDGGVGLYSVDPLLFGNVNASAPADQALLDEARKNGEKTNLAFVLPAPYITDANGTKITEGVSYKLQGNILTLEAKDLKSKSYPLSIDPTVVVTTTADFATGRDDGMINYGTANQIGRSDISAGTVGTTGAGTVAVAASTTLTGTSTTFTTTFVVGDSVLVSGQTPRKITAITNNTSLTVNTAFSGTSSGLSYTYFNKTTSFSTARNLHASVAYNGYLYVIGGLHGTSDTACNGSATTYCSDIQKAAINSDGTLGSWSATTSLAIPRYGHAAVAYNGYLYVIGGVHPTSDTACNGTSSQYCSDVQKAVINSDGTLGTFSATSSFTAPRYGHTSVAYNGYLYVIGGVHPTSDTACNGTSSQYCSDVQKAAINADGTLGSFSATSSFSTARLFHTSVAYNGYMYVIGGLHAAADTLCNGTSTQWCSDVQKATINADGTLGSFSATTSFTTARESHTSVAYNGYLYVIGGDQTNSDTACNPTTSSYCSDVQKATINADGTLGSWSATTSFSTVRNGHTSVAYNGYLYVIGGEHLSSDTACNGSATTFCSDVQFTPFNTGTPTTFGTVGTTGVGTVSVAASTTLTGSGTSFNSFDVGQSITVSGQTPRTITAIANDTSLTVNSAFSGTSSGLSYQYFDPGSALATARREHTTVVYNGYVYTIGGFHGISNTDCNGTASVYCSDVQKATISVNGIGAWSSTTSFTTARYGHTSVAYNGYLYVIGGADSASTYKNDVQKAIINSDGTIGTWSTTTAFTTARYNHTSVAYNGYMYVIGGYDGSTYYNDVQKATINSDGTLGSWSTTTAFTTGRSGHTTVAYNGYLYVIGGADSVSTYKNDVQKAAINSDGTLGSFSSTTAFNIARGSHTSVAYAGLLYVIGGNHANADTLCSSPSNTMCKDVWYTPIAAPAQRAAYERTIDVGSLATTVDSVVYNGSAPCGVPMQYQTAGSNGVFSAWAVAQVSSVDKAIAYPGVTYSISTATKRYVRLKFILDDSSCGTNSNITDITLTYSGGATPAAPTLTAPSSGATGVSVTPLFQFRTTDADNDYLRYKIEVCSTSNCSSIVRTIDQTSSQTGWTGQDTQASTAYVGNSSIGSSTMANHTYQATALSASTQYWWRAYAIDPGNTNTFSSASSIFSFTTASSNVAPDAPTLTAPAASATGVSTLPTFILSTNDSNGDYVKFKIEVCSTSNCSSVVRTIDQTSSQTGWIAQDANSGAAYASNSAARHVYQAAALTQNTQYWWRAYAKDPGGSNTFGTASSIGTFTTATQETNLNGGIIINGGTRIGN